MHLEQSQILHPSLIFLQNPSAVSLSKENQQSVIQALLSHYSQAQPIAGKDYWATRVWTLIIWQPIYLSVYSVHVMKKPLNLCALQQRVELGVIYGYGFQGSTFEDEDSHNPQMTLAIMAQRLKQMMDDSFESLNALMTLNKANSYGLIADSIMHALLALQELDPCFDDQTLIELAKQWCHELGLVNRKGQLLSELQVIELKNLDSQLVLKRKSCCKHYLVDQDDLCTSCSRQSWQTRIKRYQSEKDR
jgi:siderophore ferric iron reductase